MENNLRCIFEKKKKIIYVLVSTPNDIYLEQAYISMYSLRYYMPEVHITLLTDRLTADSFIGVRKEEIKYVDELVVVDLDGKIMTAQKRSRQLKTSVRNRIDGDFLFVDCDTIITRPLDDIDKVDSMIAACRDTHVDFAHNPYRDMALRHGKLVGWPIEGERDYFNSGVIFVKDTPETHEFYRRWNENLNLGYPKQVFMDQPSFAKTNYEMGHVIQHLPDVWNCELKHGIRYLKDAYIVHYLCTNSSKFQDRQLFLLNEKDVLLEVKRTGLISDEIVETIKDPFRGIAEVTHCFAGDDVFFFRTNSYIYLRSKYVKGKLSIVDMFLQVIQITGKYKRKVVKMFGLGNRRMKG